MISHILWAAYPVQPIRLKERYPSDLAAHAIMAGPLLLLVVYTLRGTEAPRFTFPGVTLCILFTCIGSIALLVYLIGDYDQDRYHSATTVVQIGKKKGWILLSTLFMFSLTCIWEVDAILILNRQVVWGSIAFFAIPGINPCHEIRRDFFPTYHP